MPVGQATPSPGFGEMVRGLGRALAGGGSERGPRDSGAGAARSLPAAAPAGEDERLRQVIEHAPDAIMIVQAGRYAYLNPAALRLFGAAAAEQLLGCPAIERLHPDCRAAVSGRIASVTAHGKVAPLLRERYLRLDGAEVDVEVTGTSMLFGGSQAILVFARDISERVRIEAERAALQDRIVQAAKLEAVGRLAAGIAHDFNNHLSTILGYSEMVRDSLAPDDPRRESLAAVATAGDRAAELTRQLLAFGRRQLLQMEAVDLSALLERMHGVLASAVGDDVELERRSTVRLPLVMADTRQIEQAVLTLVMNARDSLVGGGRIVVETSAATLGPGDPRRCDGMPPGPYVLLSVRDSGPGPAQGAGETIWEPYAGSGDPGPGGALGMAAVFGIVKQHAAFVRVDGGPGKGTAIGVWFPAAAAAGEPARGEEIAGGDETVLVVDDEEVLRRLAVDVLRPLGYTVLEAAGGEAALGILDGIGRPVDLLVTDVVMPDMNGPDLARRFRQRAPRAAVLFMTGYAGAFWKAGSLGDRTPVLHKPFTMRKLAAAVRTALDEAAGAGAAPEVPQP